MTCCGYYVRITARHRRSTPGDIRNREELRRITAALRVRTRGKAA